MPATKCIALLFWDKEIYQEAVGIIDGSVYYNSKGEEPDDSNQKTTRADQESHVRENLTGGLACRYAYSTKTARSPLRI